MAKMVNFKATLIGAVFAFIATACGKSSTDKVAESDVVKWDIEFYNVIPYEVIDLTVDDADSYSDVLPLRMEYGREETAKVDALFAQNDSLLADRYSHHWLEYNGGEINILIIIPAEPLLRQEGVEITKVDRLSEDSEDMQVAFRLDDARKWKNITAANIGKQIAISVNGQVLNAPRVMDVITSGNCTVIIPVSKAKDLLPATSLQK